VFFLFCLIHFRYRWETPPFRKEFTGDFFIAHSRRSTFCRNQSFPRTLPLPLHRRVPSLWEDSREILLEVVTLREKSFPEGTSTTTPRCSVALSRAFSSHACIPKSPMRPRRSSRHGIGLDFVSCSGGSPFSFCKSLERDSVRTGSPPLFLGSASLQVTFSPPDSLKSDLFLADDLVGAGCFSCSKSNFFHLLENFSLK